MNAVLSSNFALIEKEMTGRTGQNRNRKYNSETVVVFFTFTEIVIVTTGLSSVHYVQGGPKK